MAEVDEIIDQPSDAEKRIKSLSDKVKVEAEGKAAAEKARAEAEAKAAEAQRVAEFSEGFADIVAENPAAREHKDEIKAKVLGGMSIEDAKFAVLGKAGKLGVAPIVETATISGGSAPTTITSPQGNKSIDEMTQAERRQALAEATDLQDILAPRRQ